MQKEFRNSQFINIYFHKFAPSRRSPPCWPWSFLLGEASTSPHLCAVSVSPVIALAVSARGCDHLSQARPLGLCDLGGWGQGCASEAASLSSTSVLCCPSLPCLRASLSPVSLCLCVSCCLCVSGGLSRFGNPAPARPCRGRRPRCGRRGAPFGGSEGRGRFPGNRRPIGGVATD